MATDQVGYSLETNEDKGNAFSAFPWCKNNCLTGQQIWMNQIHKKIFMYTMKINFCSRFCYKGFIPGCHIQFMHAFSALYCILEVLTLVCIDIYQSIKYYDAMIKLYWRIHFQFWIEFFLSKLQLGWVYFYLDLK